MIATSQTLRACCQAYSCDGGVGVGPSIPLLQEASAINTQRLPKVCLKLIRLRSRERQRGVVAEERGRSWVA